MTQAKQSRRSPLKILVTAVAVVVVVLYVSAGIQVKSYSEGYVSDYDVRSYIYPVESGRFGDLYDVTIRDMNKKTEYSAEVAECRALAFYYEQAVLENAYRQSGDNEKADEFAKRMEEYAGQLGSISARAEAVREAVVRSGG